MQAELAVLRKLWGYSSFRTQQEPIVQAVSSGRDVIAVLPTGGGKSIAFQVPALLKPGTTLVVTPLVALMEDQVKALRTRRVAAACLHGEQPPEERRENLEGLAEGRWALFYLSPETLLSPPVWSRLTQIEISRIVLDEAHCLTGWGSSFRPSYHRLGAARRALGNPPLCAFTATATPQAIADLERLLGLVDPLRLVVPPYRENLRLQVRWMWTPAQRRSATVAFLRTQAGGSGLIYLRTRAGTEALAHYLVTQGFQTTHYHAGLEASERRERERGWLAGRWQFLTCTNAFGMGVDAPHVRWVVHAHQPPTLEEYLQEIGRAGRDGELATALLLASEPTGYIEATDRTLQQHFRREQQTNWQKAEKALAHLPATGTCTKANALSLALLHERGLLTWETPFDYRLLRARPPAAPVQTSSLLRAYLLTHRCRWQFLLAAFGFEHQPGCGHCDRCRP